MTPQQGDKVVCECGNTRQVQVQKSDGKDSGVYVPTFCLRCGQAFPWKKEEGEDGKNN